MIRRIQIDNFKSLDGFSLPPAGSPPLANFTGLIGANGSGKSTVLQALDFLSHLVRGNFSEWLRERNWTLQELSSKLSGTEQIYIDFRVELQTASTLPVYWHCTFLPGESRISNESVAENGQWLLTTWPGPISLILNDRKSTKEYSGLKYSGSVLSILDDRDLHPSLQQLKRSLGDSLANFELVSPFNLKQDSQPSKAIGAHGENFPGFLHVMSDGIRDRVYTKMKEFFPFVNAIQREEKIDAQIRLSSFEKNMRTLDSMPDYQVSDGISSRHFSDGFTRILAVVAQIESCLTPGPVQTADRILLLDEIENGIHPELMAKFVRYLAEAPVQIIATTHSPLILNYLSDKQAEESVILLYRNSTGRTRSCRYFDLPSAKKKLGILGPGEVYLDTSIEQIAREAEDMERGASAQADAVEL